MNLYMIDSAILDCVDAETGEIFDIDRFEELSLERDVKIENIALWIKNLKAEAEALKAEKDAFAKRQKSVETKLNGLKAYLEGYLEGTAYKSTRVNITFRKSESVYVEEGANIPDEYLRFKEPEVDKVALKDAIKKGIHIDGVEIVTKNGIQIK